jgi:7-cyano-7-deazaguanine synthase
MSSDSIAIFSGGMDSTVLVYKLLDEGHVPHLLSFNYGQRHSKELLSAEIIAYELKLQHDIVDLTGLTHLISNSALTAPTGVQFSEVGHEVEVPTIEVPEGHYAEDNMKKTVVPNRNMIMLSIAAGVAVNNSYKFVATGVHAGDHFVYPDCRPEFIWSCNETIVSGNEGFGNIPKHDEAELAAGKPFYRIIEAPFLNVSKEDIAYLGLKFKVPFHLTWSCYKGGDKHCGKCGTCVERLEAIDGAQKRYHQEHQTYGPVDRTDYEDTEFWKEAVANAR